MNTFIQSCSAQIRQDLPDHHINGGFKNVYEFKRPSFGDLIKWRWNRSDKHLPEAESYSFPLAENDPDFLGRNIERTTITWVGHATVLLQMNGLNVLTDPHFSDRASPFQWIGPKRVVQPGIKLRNLPHINLVVISHNHYDHLDKESVLRLAKRQNGKNTLFLVPLGLKAWFKDLGIENVRELDWWEKTSAGSLTVTAVPVHHWSKRTLFTENDSLWAGWIVESTDETFFFVGDTGYSPVFKDIGQRLGPIDYCAIPIGAYEPRWFMKSQHISPEESVMIHKDCRCRKSIAIHWGTFILTDEPLDEPPRKLAEIRKKEGIKEVDFYIPRHGETILLPDDP